MDKNGKINGRFSIIDLFVIILAAVLVVGIAVRYGAKATTAVKSSEEFECVLNVNNVRSYTVKALEKKGVITDKKSEVELGEIIAVEVKDAEFQSTTADGRIVMTNLPDRYNCKVTIRAKGKVSEDAYVMNDSNELSVGRNMDIFSKYVRTSGEIMKVEMIKD